MRAGFITTSSATFRRAMAIREEQTAAIEWAAEWERGIPEPERRERMAEAIQAVRADGGTPYPGPVAVALRRIIQGGAS